MKSKKDANELAHIKSLIERTEKPSQFTAMTAQDNFQKKLINEMADDRTDTTLMDGMAYNLNSPQELVNTLSKAGFSPKKSWFVTLGYVNGVTKLGNKSVSSAVEKFDDDTVNNARSLNSPFLNDLIDNPQTVEKGINKGKINNPYSDSYSNFIIEASIVRLQFGRQGSYADEKNAALADIEQYEKDNPEDVAYYKEKMGLVAGLADQAYDDARNDKSVHVPNTPLYQKDIDSDKYEMRFNTPQNIFNKTKSAYFLVKDENTVVPLTQQEVESYINLFGVIKSKKVEDDAIIAKVKKTISDIKTKHHGANIFTKYDLDKIFLMNFTAENDPDTKLQYYNPDVIINFVKGRSLKSGDIPGRQLAQGVMTPHLATLAGNE